MEKTYIGTLRERGLRVTPQRERVWRLLSESGEHFTPEEVWERVRGGLPGMELSTVYRVLEALHGAGLVVESRLPEGPKVYEAASSSHPHLICDRCGTVSHPGPGAEERLARVAEELDLGGFRARELRLIAVGLCARCAREG